MAIESNVKATIKKDVAPVKATATIKADALKTDIKTPEVKAEAKPAAKKTTAKKAAAKKPAAKKTAAAKPAAKKTAAKPAAKKTAAAAKPAAKKTTAKPAAKKTAAAKKPAAKKTAKKTVKKAAVKTSAVFAISEGENLTFDALMKKYLKTAKDRCKFDLGIKAADIKSIDLYLNIKEQMVYSVINGETNDQFEMY